MSTQEIEQTRTPRGGVPLAVWLVAALLWVLSTGAVAIFGDDPVLAPRAALFAVACVGVGAICALVLIGLKRRADIAVTLVLITASQIGRDYIVEPSPVGAAEAWAVIVGTVAVYIGCRALASRVAARQ